LIEGKNVRLRLIEKEDVDFFLECYNNQDFWGEYDFVTQMSKAEVLRSFDDPTPLQIVVERVRFIIEKKDGKKIGYVHHRLAQPDGWTEIGYLVIPSERRKGHGTEAIQLMVDYLFLSRDIVRVQAGTHVRNRPSQKTLEKAGFKREGTIRKAYFIRGEWADHYMYSILREEWKEPRALCKIDGKKETRS
jgi:RimJ/RimL family protein N-acetyltransferase